MAELLVKGITVLSYRECVRQVSEMTGQTISAMAVWNVIQALGKRAVPVLFEEADGVYI